MVKDKKKEDNQVVARLSVAAASNVQTIRRFDKAWTLAMDLASAGSLPVSIKLDGFVRKDSSKDEFVIRY